MNRRTFLQKGALSGGAFLVGTPFFLPAIQARSSLHRIERVYVSMGTTVRFLAYHEDERDAVAAIHEAQAVVEQVHRLMSIQDAESELSRWNASPTGLDAPFHPLTAGAIEEAVSFVHVTNRRFDPTMGETKTRHRHGEVWVTTSDWLDAWDREERRLTKVHPELRLDLGGSAKGWAVDRAMEILEARGIATALVNAGGDLCVSGPPPGDDHWHVGIRNPLAPDETFCDLTVSDVAVATSGGYEPNGSTIVDPRDGHPVSFAGSATVLAPSCGAADCLSTAAFVEPDRPVRLNDVHTLIARPEAGTLVVEHDPRLRPGTLSPSTTRGRRVDFQSNPGL